MNESCGHEIANSLFERTRHDGEQLYQSVIDAAHNPYVELAAAGVVLGAIILSRGKLAALAEEYLPKASIIDDSSTVGGAGTSRLLKETSLPLADLAASPLTPEIARDMAIRADASGPLLDKLADYAPLEVARHINTESETLGALARHSLDLMWKMHQREPVPYSLQTLVDLQKAITVHPNVSVETLDTFVTHEAATSEAFLSAALNPRTSSKSLKVAIAKGTSWVSDYDRELVEKRALMTPSERQQELARLEDQNRRIYGDNWRNELFFRRNGLR